MYDCVMSDQPARSVSSYYTTTAPQPHKESCMDTRRVNGKPDSKPIYCPHCGQVLEEGRTLLLSTKVTGTAYICPTCKVIFLPDVKPLARLSEGVN